MTRGKYNEYRGWTMPEDEDPADDGFLVVYSDGYETWSPKKQFVEAYSLVSIDNKSRMIDKLVALFEKEV